MILRIRKIRRKTAIGRTSMSKINCKRGGDRVAPARKSTGASTSAGRQHEAEQAEGKTSVRSDEIASACAGAAKQLGPPDEKKRLINLERRAQFQRLGGSAG
jgi:hypothetical protein